MIVDLMRNDLGRVCRYASVSVEDPRSIETHADSVLQASATVTGRLREGMGLSDLLKATLPGGSVTGAPKIRAMQIIDEIETSLRGPYCGAIGYVSPGGRASFNIAIRTALLTGPRGPADAPPDQFAGATLDYSVGAGIVADSQPDLEWQETLDKAEILHRTLDAGAAP